MLGVHGANDNATLPMAMTPAHAAHTHSYNASASGTANYYLSLVSQHLNSLSDFGATNLSAVYELDIIDNNSSTQIFVVIADGRFFSICQNAQLTGDSILIVHYD